MTEKATKFIMLIVKFDNMHTTFFNFFKSLLHLSFPALIICVGVVNDIHTMEALGQRMTYILNGIV